MATYLIFYLTLFNFFIIIKKIYLITIRLYFIQIINKKKIKKGKYNGRD